MADVSDFIISCVFSHIVNLGWCVVVAHLGPTELPIRSVGIRIQRLVAHAVLCAPLVSEPDVVACLDELECWSNIRPMHDPAVGRVDDSMLQEHNLRARLSVIGGNSVDVEDVAVVSRHWVRLELVSVLLDDLLECLVEVWVGLEGLDILVLVPARRLQIVNIEIINLLLDIMNFMMGLVEQFMRLMFNMLEHV